MNALSAMKADAAACNARLTSLRATPSLEARVDGLLAAVAVLQGQVAELRRITPEPRTEKPKLPPHVMEVVEAVAELHDVTVDEILTERLKKHASWARFNVWHHLHSEAPKRYSLSWLGRKFGRDHTSVMHGIAQWDAKGKAYMEAL
jgi:chromosomal replication initiation ATPase DnaA